ncbi:MAG: hydrogenase formation protein HypD [Kiritimatiellae bacterium]|jgi:hydrogenase expression/formation protein HypD|nr:hydrogenase formation protein HypD [Kiritimatiellia bacterium]
MIKYVDEYRDVDTCLSIAEKIREISTKPLNIMEVCGGHTMSIRKNGIQKLVGDNINLLSGPGCPVCVTAIKDIDKAIALSQIEDVIICSFGDMIYVPGSKTTLAQTKAEGKDIRTVYSVSDALKLAKEEPLKKVVFIGIGFETTAPTIAAAIVQVYRENIDNFSVLSLHKTMPQALGAVLSDESCIIDALICPGHVTTITGTDMYEFIVKDLGISCCVSGFEPVDILRAIYMITEMFENNQPALLNAYERVVKPQGNIKAQDILAEVFKSVDADWRGCGIVPDSGLGIKDKYEKFDADKIFDINVPDSKENSACICGDILRGAKNPNDCTLFKTACTPMNPQGACMVSSEGTCAAWYKYGE